METNLIDAISKLNKDAIAMKSNFGNIISLLPNTIEEAKKTATSEQVEELNKAFTQLQNEFKNLSKCQ